MRRITMWILATVCGVVLLFSYRTSTMGAASASAYTAEQRDSGTGTSGGSGTSDGSGTPSSSPTASGGSSGSGATSGSGTTTTKGAVAQTRWGPVQVQVKITNHKLVDVVVLQHPNENRKDQEINDYALPLLRKAALAAQSADIDTVSGATVTSDGYRQSLQSALDAAHFQA